MEPPHSLRAVPPGGLSWDGAQNHWPLGPSLLRWWTECVLDAWLRRVPLCRWDGGEARGLQGHFLRFVCVLMFPLAPTRHAGEPGPFGTQGGTGLLIASVCFFILFVISSLVYFLFFYPPNYETFSA